MSSRAEVGAANRRPGIPARGTACLGRDDSALSPLTSPIAVAVSGGPDSMALLHLLHAAKNPPLAGGSTSRRDVGEGVKIVAVTVDHGLRAESLDEARAVAAWCKKHKIEHHILTWQGERPKTGVHEAARAARYELLENFCRKHGILHLAIAHHADDNAETILQRIAKASGPQGLAGMAEHAFTSHLHLWRPLLSHTKKELVDYCEHFKIPFVRDPSNENPKYARGRLRGAARILAAEGMTAQNLNLLAQKQYEVVKLWDHETARFLASNARLCPPEGATIDAGAFVAAPVAVQRMALDYVLKLVSGQDAPIRYERLSALCAALAAKNFRAKTLGHCKIAFKQKCVILVPEKSRG